MEHKRNLAEKKTSCWCNLSYSKHQILGLHLNITIFIFSVFRSGKRYLLFILFRKYDSSLAPVLYCAHWLFT